MATRRGKKNRNERFPWGRAALVMLVLWGSLWAAAAAGAALGSFIYDDRYAAPAPYTEEQLRSMQRVAPEAADLATRDLHLWAEGVEMGRSVAKIEGALAGAMLLLAAWGTLAVVWLWGRERERAHRRVLDFAEAREA